VNELRYTTLPRYCPSQCVSYPSAHWRWSVRQHMAISTHRPFSCSAPPSTALPPSFPSITNSPRLLNAATKISTSDAITSEVSRSLAHCPSDYYILVSQPGVTASDYLSRKTHTTLAQRLADKPHSSIRSSITVPEAIGDIDLAAWTNQLRSSCHLKTTSIDATSGSIPTTYDELRGVILVHLPAPSTSRKQDDLAQNDALIASLLDMIPSSNYTVLYTTSPSVSISDEKKEYTTDFDTQEALHTDLRRDLGSAAKNSSGNSTLVDGPLFHRYQFFTPGMWLTLRQICRICSNASQVSSWASSHHSYY
jgi:hypothetical protein